MSLDSRLRALRMFLLTLCSPRAVLIKNSSKRYSRLPAKYGIDMGKKSAGEASDGTPGVEETPKKKEKAAKATPTSNKKRKVTQEVKAEDEYDE